MTKENGTLTINSETDIVSLEEMTVHFGDFEAYRETITSRLSACSPYVVMRSAILSLDGVKNVDIREHPQHTVEIIVEGGNFLAIAETIYENSLTGILTFGNVWVNLTDNFGIIRTVRFSRPTYEGLQP